MTTPAPPQTAAALPPPAGLAGAAGLVLALAAGAATGWGAAGLSVERLPDASLRIAAVVTLPLPVLLLGWLTTPQLFGVRAWLGETGPSALAHARTEVLRLAVWCLLGAAACLGAANLGGLPLASASQLAAALAMSTCSVLGATTAAVLLALRVVASGGNAAWSAVSGGANFGPQETAPLLYAPGLGWIAGLVPVAVWSAVWAAQPALLTFGVQAAAVIAAAVLLWRLLDWGAREVEPVASRALQVAAAAHALPFAVAQVTPPPPAGVGAEGSFVALVFARWHGALWWTPPGLALALALAVGPQTPAWLVAGMAAAAAAWSPLRSTQLLGLEEDACAQWLGASPATLRQERRALALRLAAGALALPLLGWPTGQWLAAAAGTLLGAVVGVVLVGWRPVRWASQLALLLAFAAAAVAPAAARASGPKAPVQEPDVDLER